MTFVRTKRGFRAQPSPPKQWPTKMFRVWELGKSPQDAYEVDADDLAEALAIAGALGIRRPMVKLAA